MFDLKKYIAKISTAKNNREKNTTDQDALSGPINPNPINPSPTDLGTTNAGVTSSENINATNLNSTDFETINSNSPNLEPEDLLLDKPVSVDSSSKTNSVHNAINTKKVLSRLKAPLLAFGQVFARFGRFVRGLRTIKLVGPRLILAALMALILPFTIFATLYEGAYGQMGKMPHAKAAIVNQDIPVVVDDQIMPLGRELAGKLVDKNAGNFDWQLTTDENARDGLQSGDYLVMVVIPEDFSANVTSNTSALASLQSASESSSSANTSINNDTSTNNDTNSNSDSNASSESSENSSSDSESNSSESSSNGSTSDLASQIKTTVPNSTVTQADIRVTTSPYAKISEDEISDLLVKNAAALFNDEYANEFVENIFVGFSKIKESFTKNAAQTDKFFDAFAPLKSGSSDLSSGLSEMKTGTSDLGSASQTLYNSADILIDGAAGVKGGFNTIWEAAGKLRSGIQTIEASVKALKKGVDEFNKKAKALPTTAEINLLISGQNDIQTDLEKIRDWVSKEKDYVQGEYDTLCPVGTVSNECTVLERTLNDLKCLHLGDNTSCSASGAVGGNRIYSIGSIALANLATNDVIQLILKGIPSIKSAVTTLATNVTEFAKGITRYKTAFDEYYDGVSQYRDGLDRFADGVIIFADGVKRFTSATETLGSGISQSAQGAKKLSNGISELSKGADKFKAQIDNLKNAIPDLTAEESQSLADSVVESVTRPVTHDMTPNKNLPFVFLLTCFLATLILLILRKPFDKSRLLTSPTSSLVLTIKSLIAPAIFTFIITSMITLFTKYSSLNFTWHQCAKLMIALSVAMAAFVLLLNLAFALFKWFARILAVSFIAVLVGISIFSPVFAPLQTVADFSPITPAVDLLRNICIYNIFLIVPAVKLVAWAIVATLLTIMVIALNRKINADGTVFSAKKASDELSGTKLSNRGVENLADIKITRRAGALKRAQKKHAKADRKALKKMSKLKKTKLSNGEAKVDLDASKPDVDQNVVSTLKAYTQKPFKILGEKSTDIIKKFKENRAKNFADSNNRKTKKLENSFNDDLKGDQKIKGETILELDQPHFDKQNTQKRIKQTSEPLGAKELIADFRESILDISKPKRTKKAVKKTKEAKDVSEVKEFKTAPEIKTVKKSKSSMEPTIATDAKIKKSAKKSEE